jgi:hypothetical protein
VVHEPQNFNEFWISNRQKGRESDREFEGVKKENNGP